MSQILVGAFYEFSITHKDGIRILVDFLMQGISPYIRVIQRQ